MKGVDLCMTLPPLRLHHDDVEDQVDNGEDADDNDYDKENEGNNDFDDNGDNDDVDNNGDNDDVGDRVENDDYGSDGNGGSRDLDITSLMYSNFLYWNI